MTTYTFTFDQLLALLKLVSDTPIDDHWRQAFATALRELEQRGQVRIGNSDGE